MTTYKFLTHGGRGPLTGFAWPLPSGAGPGPWVEADGALAPCARGAHVCRTHQLAHWLSDELWETEIAGAQVDAIDCIVVERARLVRRVAAWSAAGAERFAAACAAHARALAGAAPAAELRDLLEDASAAGAAGYTAVAAYCGALVVAKLARPSDTERAYADERAWQSAWIARELIAG